MTKCGHCGSSLNASALGTRFADDPLQGLQEAEQEILRLQLLLDELIERRRSFKQEINNRYCPVLQLPPEISTEIFSHCLPSVYSLPSISVKDLTPYHLGHVCRAWRDTVWSTPRLWSTICLNLSDKINLSLITRWMMFSGQHPLSVSIDWGRWPSDDSEEFGTLFDNRNGIFMDVLDAVASFSAQLHTMDVRVPGKYFYDSGDFAGFSEPLPLLTSVSLHNVRISLSGFPVMLSAPHLEEIRLTGCGISEKRSRDFNIRQVKHILLRSMGFNECLVFLNHVSPVDCTLINIVRSPEPVASVQMPYLETLTVESAWGITELLSGLTAPAMLQLAIVSASTSPFSLSKFVYFLRRSSCSLRSLSLSGAGVCGTQLFECLQLLPSLVKLELSSGSLRDEIVQLLGPFPAPGHSQCLLPNLEVLGYAGQLDFNSLSISGILLFRWRQGICGRVAQLRRVALRTMIKVSEAPAVSQYRYLVAEGLDLSIGTAEEFGTAKECWL